jgi:hypothetical protein
MGSQKAIRHGSKDDPRYTFNRKMSHNVYPTSKLPLYIPENSLGSYVHIISEPQIPRAMLPLKIKPTFTGHFSQIHLPKVQTYSPEAVHKI